jgi:hypothetical protein
MPREVIERKGNKVKFREELADGTARTWEEDYDKAPSQEIETGNNPLDDNPNNVAEGGRYWVAGRWVNANGDVIGGGKGPIPGGQLQSKAAQNFGDEGAQAEGDNDEDDPQAASKDATKASGEATKAAMAAGVQTPQPPKPAEKPADKPAGPPATKPA